MKKIHDRVRDTLQKNTKKYKEKANERKRDVEYKVEDLVMTHLKKERLSKGKPRKFLMKKTGPCWIVHKFGPNAYEIELLQGLDISPIFNVSDLFPYKGDNVPGSDVGLTTEGDEGWVKNLPPSQPLKLESILGTKVIKKTRKKTYNEYLVKWSGLPTKDATWMNEEDIFKHCTSIADRVPQVS
ncbi:uncharacterized protein LOC131860013 [Cryptomeria japonica]|uniref:uncharacterized protein LOC131860013 n=1 Tax=Cryptomeria japonica TaxID=3369 RepID=UPI0027DAA709|nr:uncharacterized protein LOC131860013 [Cryptomeria japonica]